MLHGSETLGPNILDLKWLRPMIRWICGTKDQVETSSASLLQKLGSPSQMVWTCTAYYVLYQICHKPSTSQLQRERGRPRKTWFECVKTDSSDCGLTGVDPQDRETWRAIVRHSLVLLTPLNETRTDSTLI